MIRRFWLKLFPPPRVVPLAMTTPWTPTGYKLIKMHIWSATR